MAAASTAPRPRISPKPVLQAHYSIYLGLAALGLMIASLAFWLSPPTRFDVQSVPVEAKDGGASSIHITMIQKRSSFWAPLINGVGMAFLTVAFYEIGKFIVESVQYRREGGGKDFNEFFGDNASSASDRGVILLQSDNVDNLVKEALEDGAACKPSEEVTYERRSYKAREWLNRWDTRGAREIRDTFRRLQLHAPTMELADHSSRADHLLEGLDGPFLIAMGLGFTDAVWEITKDLTWMRVERKSLCGDCLQMKTELVPSRLKHLWPDDKENPPELDLTMPDSSVQRFNFHAEKGFIRILPKEWNIATWINKQPTSNDYAIILRRTFFCESRRRRKVAFVVAGFTEVGTAIAAKYLAECWEDLWESYVRKKYDKEESGYGDFLIVIQGKSNIDKALEWKVEFKVTPESIKDREPYTWPLLGDFPNASKSV